MDPPQLRLCALRWRNIQDLAGFVQRQAGGREGVGGGGVLLELGGVSLGGGGLFVGFGEGAADDAGAGEDYLGYYAVRLVFD